MSPSWLTRMPLKKGHSFAHEATPRCRWQGFNPPSVLHQRVASVVLNPTDFIQVHKNGVVMQIGKTASFW
jgi:hypothetical protein